MPAPARVAWSVGHKLHEADNAAPLARKSSMIKTRSDGSKNLLETIMS
jgi:hypothetical protein